jgi:hypothetical protein
MSDTDIDTVTGFVENPDHTPVSSDYVGTYDTSGAGVNPRLENANPVFAIAREQDLQTALRALDPEDTSVPDSLVVLPTLEGADEHPEELARATVQVALEEATAAKEALLDPTVTPGAEDGWPVTKDDYEEPDAADFHRQEAHPEGGSSVGGTLANTDLIGTLDTSGLSGLGQPDASTVSAAAVEAGDVTNDAIGEDKQPNLDTDEAEAAKGLEGAEALGGGGGLDGSGDPGTTEAPSSVAGQESSPADMEGTVDTTGDTPEGQQVAEQTDGEPGVEEPKKSAKTEEWQEYARSKGATDADLEGKSRADLIAEYGTG